MTTIPVGQGDSTVIRCPSSGDISIIDMGCDGGCQGMSLEQYVTHIETEFLGNDFKRLKKVFLTHPDDDHMNYGYDKGIKEGLLEKWLKKGVSLDIYLGDRDAWVKAKGDFVTWLESNKNKFNLIWPSFIDNDGNENGWEWKRDVQICSRTNSQPDTKINMITSDLVTNPPIPNQPDSNKNARSMIMSLMIEDKKKMLFLGDFEKQSSYNFLLNPELDFVYEISNHDILMVPHHGSGSSGNPNVRFYNVVNPKYAIVSSAMWSSYKHPKMETLEAICRKRTIAVEPEYVSKPIGWISVWKYVEMGEDEFPQEFFGLQEVQDCDVEIFQTSKVIGIKNIGCIGLYLKYQQPNPAQLYPFHIKISLNL